MYGATNYTFSRDTTTYHDTFFSNGFGTINRILHEEEREFILLKWIMGVHGK